MPDELAKLLGVERNGMTAFPQGDPGQPQKLQPYETHFIRRDDNQP